MKFTDYIKEAIINPIDDLPKIDDVVESIEVDKKWDEVTIKFRSGKKVSFHAK